MNTSLPAIIRRPDIGLAVAGTRISLYTIMDYLREGQPREEIAAWLNLTSEQMQAAIDYIEAHRPEVEAEYAEILQDAEQRRHFWEARLREHLARQRKATPSPEKSALYARLAEQRANDSRASRQ